MFFLSRRSTRLKVVHFLVICPFRQSQKLVSLLTKARLETRKNEKEKNLAFICLLQIPNFLHRSSKKKSFQKPKKEITGCCTDHSKANRAVTAASCCQLPPAAAAICRPRLEIKPPPFCIICKGEGFCFVFFAPKETFFLEKCITTNLVSFFSLQERCWSLNLEVSSVFLFSEMLK